MSDNPIKKGRYNSLRKKASSIREKKRYVERYNRHNSANNQYRAIRQQKKTVALNNLKTGGSIFGLVILFLLLASLTRRISNGSMPTFTGFLSYLSTFEQSSLPFNSNTGVGLLDFLTFIFSNAVQGFQIFFGIIKFLFFG